MVSEAIRSIREREEQGWLCTRSYPLPAGDCERSRSALVRVLREISCNFVDRSLMQSEPYDPRNHTKEHEMCDAHRQTKVCRTKHLKMKGEHMEANDSDQQIEDEKGPTEKLRDQEKSEAEQLVPGTEVPGAQNPASEEIKDEKGPNTE
jgi:hypothetical protein